MVPERGVPARRIVLRVSMLVRGSGNALNAAASRVVAGMATSGFTAGAGCSECIGAPELEPVFYLEHALPA